MRLGTLQLSGDWNESNAVTIAFRFRELEQAINDLQQAPYAHIYASQDPGMTLSLTPSGATCVLTGAVEDHIGGFDLTATSRLICRVPAYYYVNYSVSFKTTAEVNKHIEVAVIKNGIWQSASASHHDSAAIIAYDTISGSMILELQRDEYIEIGARCVGSTTVITYEHFNAIIFRVHY